MKYIIISNFSVDMAPPSCGYLGNITHTVDYGVVHKNTEKHEENNEKYLHYVVGGDPSKTESKLLSPHMR